MTARQSSTPATLSGIRVSRGDESLTNSFSPMSLFGSDILVIFAGDSINNEKNMEAITFTPAQIHALNLMSRIKTSEGLEKLRQQVELFCAKQIEEEKDLPCEK